jgi:hypothetical protein
MSIFWFFVTCVIIGIVLSPFLPKETKQKGDRRDYMDPNVFYYEDQHGQDGDDG